MNEIENREFKHGKLECLRVAEYQGLELGIFIEMP